MPYDTWKTTEPAVEPSADECLECGEPFAECECGEPVSAPDAHLEAAFETDLDCPF